MSREAILGEIANICFPRVSGDEPTTVGTMPGAGPFSPRERG